MVLYKTIADKNGGRQVELSPEEEAAPRAEWAKNMADKIAEDKLKAEEDLLAEEAINDLVKGLSVEKAAVLKKKLKL